MRSPSLGYKEAEDKGSCRIRAVPRGAVEIRCYQQCLSCAVQNSTPAQGEVASRRLRACPRHGDFGDSGAIIFNTHCD